MIMRKVYCDRCKKQITSSDNLFNIRVEPENITSILLDNTDLCTDCLYAVYIFIQDYNKQE